MTDESIAALLRNDSPKETPQSQSLRLKALPLIETLEQETAPPTTSSQLPDILLDLLTTILKPLFSTSPPNKNLTSTGRKNLITNPSLPTSITRFTYSNDEDSRPLWRTSWTAPLLRYIIRSYDRLGDPGTRRKVLEAHFHLLIPPILHQLDDVDIEYKCTGCQCLTLLCDALRGAQSGILKRSGLTDVFADALRTDFALLPTLTAEDESLALLRDLYPAWWSLVRARFTTVPEQESSSKSIPAKPSPDNEAAEEDQRQRYLTTLLRHQLLYSVNHLGLASSPGSTSSPALVTFLLAQIIWLFNDMGLASVVHLQDVLPMLRAVLMDPFVVGSLGGLEMLKEAIKALQGIVCVCWPRVKEKWWGEVLRGLVGCWVNVVDEEVDLGTGTGRDEDRLRRLRETERELKVLAALLEDIVGEEEFGGVKRHLVWEEEILGELFDGDITLNDREVRASDRLPDLKGSAVSEKNTVFQSKTAEPGTQKRNPIQEL